MNETNGKAPAPDQVTVNRFLEAVANAAETRTQLARQMFSTMMDRRRDINAECGYPESSTVTPWSLQCLHDREPIAARVNELMAKECWKLFPQVTDQEKPGKKQSPFDLAVLELNRGLKGRSWHKPTKDQGSIVNSYLKRLDEQCGIGAYGALLLGFDDGLDLMLPVKGVDERGSDPTDMPSSMPDLYAGSWIPFSGSQVQGGQVYGPNKPTRNSSFKPYSLTVNADKTKGRKLLYMRVFPQSLALVSQWENNRASPRFGQPLMYFITFNDPNQTSFSYGSPLGTTRNVHWTRVIHAADNLASSEVLGVPRCMPVLNPLLDIQKVRSADGEGYWRNAFAQMFFEMLPEFADATADKAGMRNMMEQMQNGLQRWGVLEGFSAKSVPPIIVDPTPHMDTQINVICIKLGCPRRVFEGSEEGQKAGSQDSDQWEGRVEGRWDEFDIPHVITPLYDRLIMVGCLPEPEQYFVIRNRKSSLTEMEKATVALTKTQALVAYIGGGGENVITPIDYLEQWLEFDPEKAERMLEDAEEHVADKEQEDMDKQQDLIKKGLAPDPMVPKLQPPGAPVKIKEDESLVDPATGKPVGNVEWPETWNTSSMPISSGDDDYEEDGEESVKNAKDALGHGSEGLEGAGNDNTDEHDSDDEGDTDDEPANNFNPNHDERGHFAESPGAASAKAISKEDVAPPPPGKFYAPDVEAKGPDGITLAARVGVPGDSVPPPPKIPPLPNLTPHERAVEQHFVRAYEADPDGIASKYREAVHASTKPGDPPTFETDAAKGLASVWKDPDQDTRMDNRATLNTALHQTANAVTKRAFLQELDTLKRGDQVLVTVGGCGAGKSYALENVPEALTMRQQSKAVWDAAGEQNATENPWIQREAENRGLKVAYVHVTADPYKQWADPKMGVCARANSPKNGRMVVAEAYADSHGIGNRNHQAFFEANKDNPNAKFIFLENRGKPTKVDRIPDDALKVNRKELTEFCQSAAAIPDSRPAVIRGANSGPRMWGDD